MLDKSSKKPPLDEAVLERLRFECSKHEGLETNQLVEIE
jgi:hypothetical protein